MDDYQFKINAISFKNGEIYSPGKINIVIGANNSGKSQFLKEIRSTILGNTDGPNGPYVYDTNNVIIDSIDLALPKNVEELDGSYGLTGHVVRGMNGWRVRDFCNIGTQLSPSSGYTYRSLPCSFSLQDDWHACLNNLLQPNEADHSLEEKERQRQILQFLGPMFVDYAGTEDRLLLSIGEPARGIRDDSYNTLSAALDVNETCSTISETVKRLFHKDIALDNTTSRQSVVPVVSEDFSGYRNSHNSSVKLTYMQNATQLRNEGDGFRSYVTILLTVMGASKPILLLDEPEAFLHPTYAMELGKQLGTMLAESNALQNAFISTHSSYFLQGILDSAASDLSLIRLKRNGGKSTFNILDKDKIETLKNRSDYSPQYIDALFSKKAILVEAPRDAIIYSAICDKFSEIENPIFVSTNGKDAFKGVKEFYTASGLPCRCICDFDIINDHDKFKNLMKAFSVDPEVRQRALNAADELKKNYQDLAMQKTSNKKDIASIIKERYKKDVFIDIPESLRQECRNSLHDLIRFGIYVLTTGELESLFEDSGIEHSHDSDDWLKNSLSFIRQNDISKLKGDENISELISFLVNFTDSSIS
mgnify:FL=1